MRPAVVASIVASLVSCDAREQAARDAGPDDGADSGPEVCDIPVIRTGCSGDPRQCLGLMNELSARVAGARTALAVGCVSDDDCTILDVGAIECEEPSLFLTVCPWPLRTTQICAAEQAMAEIRSFACETCHPDGDEACVRQGTCAPVDAAQCVDGVCVAKY